MIEQKRVTGGEICLPFWFSPQQKTHHSCGEVPATFWIKASLCATATVQAKSQSQWLQPWSAPCDRGLTGLTDHALTCRLDVFVALLHLPNLCRSIRNEKEMGMVQRCVSKQLRRDANASHLFVQCSLCWKGITLVCPMWNCTAIVFLVGPILLHLAIWSVWHHPAPSPTAHVKVS